MTEIHIISYLYTAVFGLSWIITESYLFESLRNKIEKKALANKDSKMWDLIDYLFNCIICMSLWTSLILLIYSAFAKLIEPTLIPLLWFSSPFFVIMTTKLIDLINSFEKKD